MNNRNRNKSIILYITLALGGIFMLFPLIWMAATSFKLPAELFTLSFIPDNPTLENYKFVVLDTLFPRWFVNSLIVAVITTVSVAFFDTLIGYIFAKFEFVGKGILFILILSTLMIPTEMLIIPWYLMSTEFGWVDTYWGILFPGIISAFGIFLMKQFMETIPHDLLDAARVDGMNEFSIFFKIAVPQVKPALSALCIFAFLGNWNAYLWPLIVISSPGLRTLPVGMAFFAGEFEKNWNLIMAASTITALPLIILFLFLQRHIIKGVVLTGMK